MSRAAHVAAVSAMTRQKIRKNHFTDISTISTDDQAPSSTVVTSSDGRPLWPWNPKHPEKYRTDRAGLPKREDLSPGLKLRKACGILFMLTVIVGLAIGIYIHLSDSEKQSENRTANEGAHHNTTQSVGQNFAGDNTTTA